MLTRILTALPLIAGFLAALLWATPSLWLGLMAAILFIGAMEWATLAKRPRVESLLYATALTLGGLLLVQTVPSVTWLYLVSLSFWLIVPWLLWRGVSIQPMLLLPLGAVVLLPTYVAIVELRETSSYLLLGIVGLVVIADSAAYFSGRRFGRHKLAPSISPGKTWEGVAGAAVGVSLYSMALGGYFSAALPGNLFVVLASALALLALSIVGDLLESWIKRQAGVKDSGTLLPGHGGVLDRIDSLTAALPAATLLYMWMQ